MNNPVQVETFSIQKGVPFKGETFYRSLIDIRDRGRKEGETPPHLSHQILLDPSSSSSSSVAGEDDPAPHPAADFKSFSLLPRGQQRRRRGRRRIGRCPAPSPAPAHPGVADPVLALPVLGIWSGGGGGGNGVVHSPFLVPPPPTLPPPPLPSPATPLLLAVERTARSFRPVPFK